MADNQYNDAVEARKSIQNDEREARDLVREQMHFNHDKDGQWDEYATRRFADRPKMQFDLTKPVIDSIAGEIEQIEFGGSVIPTGGEATEEIAETYEKMIRTISNISEAPEIFQDAARCIASEGLDGWLITTDWADVDAFDQDILIERVPNAVDRIWKENSAFATRIQDCRKGFMDTFLSTEEYNQMFPDGSGTGLGQDSYQDSYTDNKSGVVVSDYYYIKDQEKNLLLMSDGKVYDEEKYAPVSEDLARKGIQVVRERKRKIPRCFMRKMDGTGWLTKEQETPFSYIPLILAYGNKKTIERKLLYYGETLKLMDPQRVYNYAASREISDGALAPVDKIVMTSEQAKGHENQNRRLNVANDPLFLHNHTDGHPPPYRLGGPQPNPQLLSTMQTAATNIKEISLSHDPQQGGGISGHSGKAYEILNQKSDVSSFKYVKAMNRAVADTYTIIVDAIPRVYDTKNRQIRLTSEDGNTKFQAINEEVVDANGNISTINDLSQGHYMFEVKSGKAYTTQRAEEVEVLTQWAALDPRIMEEGADILYGSLSTPGMKDLASRMRKRLLDEGRIPEDQLTDKEREKILQEMEAQQNQPPNPLDDATVKAILSEVENVSSQIEERQVKMELDLQKSQRENQKLSMELSKMEADIQKTQSETLENLREATGADVIESPEASKAYTGVASDLSSGSN